MGASEKLTSNDHFREPAMRPALRTIAFAAPLRGWGLGPLAAQEPGRFSPNELVNAGHQFFGTVSQGLATVIERAVSQWGQPNGYVLGQEAGGAVEAGVRSGDGTPDTKKARALRGDA